jgi:hypothetical protein
MGEGKWEGSVYFNQKVIICHTCNSHNDVPPFYEKEFENICKDKGIQLPPRNNQGHYTLIK